MKVWLPMLVLALTPVFGVLGVLALENNPDDAVAVIFAPGVSGDDALLRVAAAGGLPVTRGGFPFVVIARTDDAGFRSHAYAQGALFVASAGNAGGCITVRRKS